MAAAASVDDVVKNLGADNLLSRNACTGVGVCMSSGVNDLDRVIDGGGAPDWIGGMPRGPSDGMGGLPLAFGAKT